MSRWRSKAPLRLGGLFGCFAVLWIRPRHEALRACRFALPDTYGTQHGVEMFAQLGLENRPAAHEALRCFFGFSSEWGFGCGFVYAWFISVNLITDCYLLRRMRTVIIEFEVIAHFQTHCLLE